MAPLDPRTECCPAKQAARDAGTFEGPGGDDWFHNTDNPCKGWPKPEQDPLFRLWIRHIKQGRAMIYAGFMLIIIIQVIILWTMHK